MGGSISLMTALVTIVKTFLNREVTPAITLEPTAAGAPLSP